jgi:hypothetical protein
MKKVTRLEAEPACQRGIVVPEPLVLEDALEMAKIDDQIVEDRCLWITAKINQ